MLRPAVFTAALLAAAMCAARAADTNQTAHTFERSVTRTVGYNYLLALPTDYKTRVEKQWPLLLFLHGAGERGDDIWAVAKHGPPKLLHSESSSPAAKLIAENFIVVSPQCRRGGWWDSENLRALLDDVMLNHRVDARRVYLTGLSMGGFGTWDLGVSHPERFAAIVPICGGGSFPVVYQANQHKRASLRTLAVWAFHGAKDPTVSPIESQRMIDMLKGVKVDDVQLTIYPDATHDSWTATFANPELYTWLLRHERTAAGSAK